MWDDFVTRGHRVRQLLRYAGWVLGLPAGVLLLLLLRGASW